MLDAVKSADSPLHGAKGEASPKPRRSRNSVVTRDEILAAATREFADKGLFGARVEEIAARTATSKHMIYYYFGSKDRLYEAVLERAYADFSADEAAVDYDQFDPETALEILIENSFDSHARKPHVIRIIMSENLDNGRHIKAMDQAPQRSAVLETNRKIITRGVQSGVFRSDIDPLQLHMTISALCFHFVSNRFTFGELFGVDLTDPAVVALRRAEIKRIVMASCRAA